MIQVMRISGLTDEEYVNLKSTLTSIDNETFNCAKCLTKYEGRQDFEDMTRRLRVRNGCHSVGNEVLHRIFLGKDKDIEYKTCIGNFVDHGIYRFLEMHKQYNLGNLPYPGCMADQPSKIIEVFGVIDSYKHDKLEKDRKAMEAKQKQQGRMSPRRGR